MTDVKIKISPNLIQELRELTGGGLLECKKALEAANGDVAAAANALRKSGKAKADKKASRIAAEGAIRVAQTQDSKAALIIEINCETDFVARDMHFVRFVDALAQLALNARVNDVAALMALPIEAGAKKTVADWREEMVAKVGENINIRRLALVMAASAGTLGVYTHGSRMGAIVSLVTSNGELAHEVAMHIVACRPVAISPNEIPSYILAAEKEIYMAQGMESGKPAAVVEKIVKGRMQKFVDSLALLNQPFVKNGEMTIANMLRLYNSDISSFVRYEVGEGIEKEKNDFAAEVMAQVEGRK